MKRMLTILFAAVLLTGGFTQSAEAALALRGPVNPFNGYPLWYQDTNGLRLDLCLDNQARNADGDLLCGLLPEPEVQVPGGPAVGSDFNPDNDIVFPGNFPSEAFWWSAEAAIDDTATGTTGLLVLAMEAAFGGATEGPVAGEQVAFGRIRIRISVPEPGLYTVTHPFGSFQYNITAVGPGNEINQTQDIGCEVLPCDFDLALEDGLAPAPGAPTDPATNEGVVNTTGQSIGPFLVPAASAGGTPLPFIVHALGRTFIADPAVENFVAGAPSGFNHFRIVGPVGSGVDVTQEQFSVTGMLSQNQPAPVNRAEYRVKTGKFHVQGTSAAVVDGPELPTAGQATVITIHLGSVPTAENVIGTATVQANGFWTFTGKAPFSPGGSTQTVSTTSSADPGGQPQILLLVLR